MGVLKEIGSIALVAAIISIQCDATFAGKDPTSVKLPAPQVAEMMDNRIGKESAKERHFRLRYMKLAGLLYAVIVSHVINIIAINVPDNFCHSWAQLHISHAEILSSFYY